MSDSGALHGPGLAAPEGALFEVASGGYHICVMPQLFNALLCVTPLWRDWHECWECGYHYETAVQALVAAVLWEPETEAEPSGWIRCLNDGRRRPDGDPAQEYINP
jgi:hypothetical protein